MRRSLSITEEHNESGGKRESGKGKSESYANEARERHGEAWISTATTVSVNITVTCRQSGVSSLTRTGRCHRNSAQEGQRRCHVIGVFREGAIIKTGTKHMI